MKLSLTDMSLAVCKLATPSLPDWAAHSAFMSFTHTDTETSLVCEAALVPEYIQAERDWRCFMIEGPLDFSLVGILAEIAGLLAAEFISIFVISTYDTDYILVRANKMHAATAALRRAGHKVRA